jgi:hypothetical protein
MKSYIAKKIESLLAASSASELDKTESESPKKSSILKSASLIGKFCRQLPVSLFNLIRPASGLDLNQDGKV